MKVDVNIIKKPAVRVEVNLARGQRGVRRMSIPVRVAPYLAEPLPVSDDNELPGLYEDPGVAVETDEIVEAVDDGAFEENTEFDEADECEDVVECDDDDIYDFSEEDDWTDGFSEDPAPDEESLLQLIAEEEAEMEAAGIRMDDASEGLPNGHYMRYLDRRENGDIYEVDDSHATGQKIICIDGESGRLSRVCGFIKHGRSSGEESSGQ